MGRSVRFAPVVAPLAGMLLAACVVDFDTLPPPPTGGGGGGDGGQGGASACPADKVCNLFVSPDGDDANPGSESQPFATPQRAADVSQPGDTIRFRAGTYTTPMLVTTSGSLESPITFQNYPNEAPTFDGAGIQLSTTWAVEVGFIVIQGFEIKSVPDYGILFYSAHDVLIRKNHIHDNGWQGIQGVGLRVVVDSNVIAGNGYDVTAAWCSPTCESNLGGIDAAGNEFTVVNNVFHSNSAHGVAVSGPLWDESDPNHPASPEYGGAHGWVISHNVFAFEGYRSGILMWQEGATGSLIEDNIFFQNSGKYSGGGNGVDFYHSGAGHMISNNMYWGDEAPIEDTESGASYTESGGLSVDPEFINVGGFDFHLGPASPARDAGSSLIPFDHDAECQPRPQGAAPDIGPYER